MSSGSVVVQLVVVVVEMDIKRKQIICRTHGGSSSPMVNKTSRDIHIKRQYAHTHIHIHIYIEREETCTLYNNSHIHGSVFFFFFFSQLAIEYTMSLFVGCLSRQLARERSRLDKKITMLHSSSSEKGWISFLFWYTKIFLNFRTFLEVSWDEKRTDEGEIHFGKSKSKPVTFGWWLTTSNPTRASFNPFID